MATQTANKLIENINWKIFLDNPEAAKPEELFRVFNGWIPDSPEIFIDVADYQHVGDGPLVLLSGHYVNYVLDSMEGRLGLLYDRRQPYDVNLDNVARLKQSLLDTLRAAKRLADDASFPEKLKFFTGELRLVMNNRALTPNTPEAFAALQPHLAKALEAVFGANGFSLDYSQGDARRRLTVTVKVKSAPSLENAIAALSGK